MNIAQKIQTLKQKINDIFERPQENGIKTPSELMAKSNAITREVIELCKQETANTNK